MTRQPDDIPVRRFQWLLLISSLTSIGFLVLAATEENFNGEWRGYQGEYRQSLVAQAESNQARQAAESMKIGIQQTYLPDLNRVDRCVSCHIGIDDPHQTSAPQPLTAHSDRPTGLVRHHAVDKFGCTVCHDGQGRAIDREAAHGDGPHWPSPLLRGEQVYTSCGRCHYENDLFGAEYDLFVRHDPLSPLDESELNQSVPGTEDMDTFAIGRGKQLVLDSGCLGCHKYRGRGGTTGPDITYVGDKTAHDFDFTHTTGAHDISSWLFEHFKKPDSVSPQTQMPDFQLTDPQARDLTLYMLSLHRKNMPAAYTPVPRHDRTTPVAAPRLYAMFCSACHGKEGHGVSYFNDRNTSVPALQYVGERMSLYDPAHSTAVIDLLKKGGDLQAAKDSPPFDAEMFEEFLKQLDVMRDVIRNGRQGVKKDPKSPLEPLNMPAWNDTLTDKQIDEILAYLIGLFPWEE